MGYQAPRGTTDILPEQQAYWQYIQRSFEHVASLFNYKRMDTPLFETTAVFKHTVGQESDIVQKEMYTFEDRGKQELTLRPEGTAAFCRAYLEHGMQNLVQPARLYYVAPMFRYDRPQAGRFRQFHQFGAEAIGDADVSVDVEIIQLVLSTIEALGLSDVTLLLNTIGDKEDRPRFLSAIQDYYADLVKELCVDCQRRYKLNPLRLLDCKQSKCQSIAINAPRSSDFLTQGSREHWEALLGMLKDLNIGYQIDHSLVRGLDYYTRTVFEIIDTDRGSQNTLAGGGRYDGLIEQLGGKATPGVGFAAGIERLIMKLKYDSIHIPSVDSPPLVVTHRGAKAKLEAMRLVTELRNQNRVAVLAPEKSLKAQMRYATGIGARKVLILGDLELDKHVVTLRDMDSGNQTEIPPSQLKTILDGG